MPFSLGQVHVAEGETDVWDEPDEGHGHRRTASRRRRPRPVPDQFQQVHRALFAARHDEGLKLQDPDVVRNVLATNGVDADEVFAAIDDGTALKQVRAEHEAAVASHNVWGVPTFISGDEAVFVRIMDRAPEGTDQSLSRDTIERVVNLLDSLARTSTSSSTPRSSADPVALPRTHLPCSDPTEPAGSARCEWDLAVTTSLR